MRTPLAEPPTPMEPVPWPSGFDDPGWLWQLKWDGVRCLAVAGDRQARLWSRRGLPRAARYPDVVRALADALDGREAVLDGELVALDTEGRPSFHLTMRRAAMERPGPAEVAALPLFYAVFDLLALDGHDLRGFPLEARLATLSTALRRTSGVHIVDTTAGGGAAFVAAVAAAGMEGAVAKRAGSHYRAGPSSEWRKVKPRRVLLALVAGHRSTGAGRLRSLSMAAYAGNVLTYLGEVGAGWSEAVAARLCAHLRALPPAPPPVGAPPARAGDIRRWVRPELALRVAYAERTPSGLLRSAVLLDFVPGAHPEARVP